MPLVAKVIIIDDDCFPEISSEEGQILKTSVSAHKLGGNGGTLTLGLYIRFSGSYVRVHDSRNRR